MAILLMYCGNCVFVSSSFCLHSPRGWQLTLLWDVATASACYTAKPRVRVTVVYQYWNYHQIVSKIGLTQHSLEFEPVNKYFFFIWMMVNISVCFNWGRLISGDDEMSDSVCGYQLKGCTNTFLFCIIWPYLVLENIPCVLIYLSAPSGRPIC